MGWTFPWVSTAASDFNYDYAVSVRGLDAGRSQRDMERPAPDDPELPSYNFTKKPFGAENPGLSAFALDDGVVYHTYSCYARGLDAQSSCAAIAVDTELIWTVRRFSFGWPGISPVVLFQAMSISNPDNQQSDHSERDAASEVYRSFLEGLNRRDLDQAERSVDVDRWREICVGYTSGVIEWPESRASMEAVWKGIPDLTFEPQQIVSDGTRVVAVGTARGRQSGRLFGAPATGRSCAASMFDYVRIENGKIVYRIQQTDMFGQVRQLFGPLLLVVVIAVCVLLIGIGVALGAALL
jgi:predicted ester cyclase